MVSACSAVIIGEEAPPGLIAFRFDQPPRTPPKWVSIRVRIGIDIASSTTFGAFRWPQPEKSLVRALLGRPKPKNHSAPRRRIVPTTAMDSTLFTVVGRP